MVTCRNEARTRSVAVLFESTFEPVGRRWWQPSLSPNPQVTTYPLEKILSTTQHGIFFTTEKRVKTSTFASRAHSRETRGAREGLSTSRRRTLATGILPSAPSGMDNASPSWLRCPRTPAFGMWTTPRSPNSRKLRGYDADTLRAASRSPTPYDDRFTMNFHPIASPHRSSHQWIDVLFSPAWQQPQPSA